MKYNRNNTKDQSLKSLTDSVTDRPLRIYKQSFGEGHLRNKEETRGTQGC